jgi:hypothetical protein
VSQIVVDKMARVLCVPLPGERAIIPHAAHMRGAIGLFCDFDSQFAVRFPPAIIHLGPER